MCRVGASENEADVDYTLMTCFAFLYLNVSHPYSDFSFIFPSQPILLHRAPSPKPYINAHTTYITSSISPQPTNQTQGSLLGTPLVRRHIILILPNMRLCDTARHRRHEAVVGLSRAKGPDVSTFDAVSSSMTERTRLS